MHNKYEIIGIVGEGAYGIVIKCRHKETGEYVAIKKFKETEDEIVKKTMKRELRMLQILKHPNVVEFKEAFKNKRNLYLVFEYVERNLLEVLQEKPTGLNHRLIKSLIYQLCLSIKYLHEQKIIHRDIKPENLLIDNNMQLKLCDFGFARKVTLKSEEALTDYVATRWYRSPELLITSGSYGPEVDYWAIGCIMGELADGIALFQGKNETDQLHCIQKVLGNLPEEQIDKFYKNPIYNGNCLLNVTKPETLERRYLGKLPKNAIDFLKDLLALDPSKRLNSSTVFKHPYLENYSDNSEKNNRKSPSHEGNRLQTNSIINNIHYKDNERDNHKDKDLNHSSIDKQKQTIIKNPSKPIVNNQIKIANTNLNIINYNIFNNDNTNNNIDTSAILTNNDISNIEDQTISKQKLQHISQIVPSSQVCHQNLKAVPYSKSLMELTMVKFPKKADLNKLYGNNNKGKSLNPKQKCTFTSNSSLNLKKEYDLTSSSSASIFPKDNLRKAASLPPTDFLALAGYKTFYNNKKDPYDFNINTQFKQYVLPLQQIEQLNSSRLPNGIIDEAVEYFKEEKKQKSKSLNSIKKPNYNWQKLSMYHGDYPKKKKQINYSNSSCYGDNFPRGLNLNLPFLGKVYKGNHYTFKQYK